MTQDLIDQWGSMFWLGSPEEWHRPAGGPDQTWYARIGSSQLQAPHHPHALGSSLGAMCCLSLALCAGIGLWGPVLPLPGLAHWILGPNAFSSS